MGFSLHICQRLLFPSVHSNQPLSKAGLDDQFQLIIDLVSYRRQVSADSRRVVTLSFLEQKVWISNNKSRGGRRSMNSRALKRAGSQIQEIPQQGRRSRTTIPRIAVKVERFCHGPPHFGGFFDALDSSFPGYHPRSCGPRSANCEVRFRFFD